MGGTNEQGKGDECAWGGGGYKCGAAGGATHHLSPSHLPLFFSLLFRYFYKFLCTFLEYFNGK